jgi:hypothetical protein
MPIWQASHRTYTRKEAFCPCNYKDDIMVWSYLTQIVSAQPCRLSSLQGPPCADASSRTLRCVSDLASHAAAQPLHCGQLCASLPRTCRAYIAASCDGRCPHSRWDRSTRVLPSSSLLLLVRISLCTFRFRRPLSHWSKQDFMHVRITSGVLVSYSCMHVHILFISNSCICYLNLMLPTAVRLLLMHANST